MGMAESWRLGENLAFWMQKRQQKIGFLMDSWNKPLVYPEIKVRQSIVMQLVHYCHCPQQNVYVLQGDHLAMLWLQPNPRPPGSPPKIQGWACRRLLHWALHSSGLSLSLALSSNVDMHLAPSSKFNVSFNRLRPSPFSCAWQHWPRNHFQVANRLGWKSHSIPC